MRKRNVIITLFLLFASFLLFMEYKNDKKSDELLLGDTVVGDVDGDGYVKANDYILVRKHILKNPVLTGDKLKRANVDGKNGVNSADYIAIRKMIINGVTPTAKPTVAPTITPTITSKPTATPKPMATPTVTPKPTATPVPTLTPSPTPVPKVTKIHFIKTATSAHDSSDAILIESNGEYGLVDASNPSSGSWAISSANGKMVLSYLQEKGVNHLKFVIASHAHSDHIGGIADVFSNSSLVNSSTTFIYKQTKNDSNAYGETVMYDGNKFGSINEDWLTNSFLETAKTIMHNKGAVLLDTTSPSSNLTVLGASYTNTGDKWTSYITFKMGDLTFKIYNLPLYTETSGNKTYLDHNSNSLVTLITSSSGKKILLSGDLNTRSSYEKYYGSLIGKVDILKANHHGYLFSNSRSLLENTKPNYVVVTGDAANEDFIAPYIYLKSIGTNVYSIKNGAVVFTIGNSITPSRSADTVSYSGTKWYRWTLENETVAWIYIENGVMQKDKWVESNSAWYYLDSDGIMSTNKWIKYNNKWCYVGSNGKAYTNGTYTIDGKSYRFDANGYCISGNGC